MIFRKLIAWLALTSLATPTLAGSNLPLVTQSGQTRQLPTGTTLAIQPSTTGAASINVPAGVAPASPANGDCWTTASGYFCQINGVTINLTAAQLANPNGTLGLANGGTGATTAATARTGLGATTIGSNLFTLTNPSAVTFPRFNADNSVTAQTAANYRADLGLGTAALQNTGTSGGTIPFLNGNNTWSGSQFLSGGASDIGWIFTGNAGTTRYVNIETAGSNRWIFGAVGDTESGGNAGSSFVIQNYTDAGGFIGNLLTLDRASSNATFSGPITQSVPANTDLTYGTSAPGNVNKLGAGNKIAYCPDLSCVPVTTGNVVHRATSALVAATTAYDAQAEEDTLAVYTIINKGYTVALARSTAYTIGQTAFIGNAVYRATTNGTTASGSPPPSTRPVSFPYTYVDGGVTWLWINDQAVNAKAGLYTETINRAGGGQSWGQANNFELDPGHTPTFNTNTELDFTNNSGTDCVAGVANCLGLYIRVKGTNYNTAGINVESSGAGAIFGSRYTGPLSHAAISLDASAPRALGIGTFTASTYTVAAIDDASTAPASLNATGTKSIAQVVLAGNAPTGLYINGTFTNQINGTGFSVSSTGGVTAISMQIPTVTVSSLGTCNSGAKGTIRTVSDASAPSWNATLTGGGAVSVMAYCNGSNWVAG